MPSPFVSLGVFKMSCTLFVLFQLNVMGWTISASTTPKGMNPNFGKHLSITCAQMDPKQIQEEVEKAQEIDRKRGIICQRFGEHNAAMEKIDAEKEKVKKKQQKYKEKMKKYTEKARELSTKARELSTLTQEVKHRYKEDNRQCNELSRESDAAWSIVRAKKAKYAADNESTTESDQKKGTSAGGVSQKTVCVQSAADLEPQEGTSGTSTGGGVLPNTHRTASRSDAVFLPADLDHIDVMEIDTLRLADYFPPDGQQQLYFDMLDKAKEQKKDEK
ncbi:hypothetical protein niasHT_034130 [Heterodera trifolii]|uniref:Uncharacterized protein n=1 Tax=Heterodera trifolii TaxID=157864 RepID=A0ABD2J5G8_9BILA